MQNLKVHFGGCACRKSVFALAPIPIQPIARKHIWIRCLDRVAFIFDPDREAPFEHLNILIFLPIFAESILVVFSNNYSLKQFLFRLNWGFNYS